MTSICSIGSGGAIRLGAGIVADGFDSQAEVRIQTHVHGDHMNGFESSKGNGTILCTHPTRDLLIATRSKFLRFNGNLTALALGECWTSPSGAVVTLFDARHIVGSAQALVAVPNGLRTLYSGDFAWPNEPPEEVDELVLDATYGSPSSVRRYSQADAEQRFLEEALTRVKSGPVTVKAHPGTLQRAIALLSAATVVPLLGTPRQHAESQVWAKHGHDQGPLMSTTSAQGEAAFAEGRYVLFYGTGDKLPDLQPAEHRITLSAFGAPEDDPILMLSERHVRIALSDHADFAETIEYVRAVRPHRVITDGSRSPHAAALAEAIKARLAILAEPAFPDASSLARGWV